MLGKGGMGTVYLGEHAIIGSKVAIKFLHPHLVGEKTLIERFFAEATSVNLIGHENIVSIFDLSMMPPNRWYLVMEYLEGVPLSTLAGTPMAPEQAVPILSQACDALQAAHAANVVHRDLKPENVFLVRRGGSNHFVKLVDFGIAKLEAQNKSKPGVTAAGLVVGTPEYMSPEQWVGEEIDGRADLYALGVIAYLLATAGCPSTSPRRWPTTTRPREKVPEPPRSAVPTLPEAYEAVIPQGAGQAARGPLPVGLRDARGAAPGGGAAPGPAAHPVPGADADADAAPAGGARERPGGRRPPRRSPPPRRARSPGRSPPALPRRTPRRGSRWR
jgi:serine/threonine-protein kinase